MTFDKWRETRSRVNDNAIIEDAFGYIPVGSYSALVYDPGVIAILPDGRYCTHIDRSGYTGTLDEVERRLWDDYAKHEVG
jgi:hypothetical protein